MMINKKEDFEIGISANIVTKDDIWLEESIRSIMNFVNEMVIIDSSSLNYKKINEEIIKSLNDKIPIKYVWKDLNITDARNLAHSMSRYSYILHWDGDMIAYDSGKNSIANIFNILKDEEFHKFYYEIFFNVLRVGYSLNTVTDRDTRYHREAWLYSNSTRMRWESRRLPLSISSRKIDQPIFHLFYKRRTFDRIYGLHLHLIQHRDKLTIKALHNFLDESRD